MGPTLLTRLDTYLAQDHALGSLDRGGLTAKSVEAANYVIALARACCRARGPTGIGVTRSAAPALGLVVRSTKLYEAIVQNVAARQAELAQILQRPLLEACASAAYLMTHPRSVGRQFILIGYKPEAQMIQYLDERARQRRLIPIERRMLESARSHLRAAGISYSRLRANKNWKLDGRDMRSLLDALGWSRAYVFGFMMGSHFTHGSWYDLSVHHLRKSGRRYHAHVEFATPGPGHITPSSALLLHLLLQFERRYRRSSPKGITRRIRKLGVLFTDIDSAWERVRQLELAPER